MLTVLALSLVVPHIARAIEPNIVWVIQSRLPFGMAVVDASFIDHNTGWAISGSMVAATRDGGVTWSTQTLPNHTSTGTGYTRIAFSDRLHGYILDDRGNVLRTQDGGNTWLPSYTQPDSLSSTYGNAAMAVLSATHVIVGMQRDSVGIRFSNNGGRTWKTALPGIDVSGISFPSPSSGWLATSERPGLLHTTNGGATWATVSISGSVTASHVFFPTASHGYATTNDGKLFETQNEGHTWAAVNPLGRTQEAAPGEIGHLLGVPDPYKSIVFEGSEPYGLLLIVTHPFETVDNGVHWRDIGLPASVANISTLATRQSGLLMFGMSSEMSISKGIDGFGSSVVVPASETIPVPRLRTLHLSGRLHPVHLGDRITLNVSTTPGAQVTATVLDGRGYSVTAAYDLEQMRPGHWVLSIALPRTLPTASGTRLMLVTQAASNGEQRMTKTTIMVTPRPCRGDDADLPVYC